jgi:hypothetical protein
MRCLDTSVGRFPGFGWVSTAWSGGAGCTYLVSAWEGLGGGSRQGNQARSMKLLTEALSLDAAIAEFGRIHSQPTEKVIGKRREPRCGLQRTVVRARSAPLGEMSHLITSQMDKISI